jgi:hypothetical protein
MCRLEVVRQCSATNQSPLLFLFLLLRQHPFLGKADTRKGMKKILSHIFLQNTMEMMNLGGI